MASDYSDAHTMHDPHRASTDAVFAHPDNNPANPLNGGGHQQEQFPSYTAETSVPVGGSGLMANDYNNGSSDSTNAVFAVPSDNQASDPMGAQGQGQQQQQ